jgi:ribonuclease HI
MHKQISLLPLTPNTMVKLHQDIVVDTALLLQKSVQKELKNKLPELTHEAREMSYMAAFEALRLFRHMAHENLAQYSDSEKTQLAEVEVEWCLDILGRLQRSDKIDE